MNYKYLIRMLPVIFAGSIFFSARSQGAWNIFSTANSPIPGNTIRCIELDPVTNVKWIGTDFGLAVFDGSNWTIYNTSNSGLPDNSIRSLDIDDSGHVWIGTFQSGLVKYDGSAWTVYNLSNSGIPDITVKAIEHDTAGNIWVGTPSGLGKYDWSGWTIWDMNNSPMISHNITCIRVDENNLKRIGTLNGGLLYFNDTTFTIYSYWTSTFPENTVTAIDMDSSGRPWIGMNASGIIVHYGGPSWIWMNTANSSIQSDVINHLHIGDNQKKYISTMNKGLIVYDGSVFVNYDSTNSPFPDSWASCAVTDTAGVVWIGTLNEGLVRLDESLLNGTNSETLPDDIRIGPIPTPDRFTVYSTGIFNGVKSFMLCDAFGNILMKKEVSDQANRVDFDISHLSPGYYVLFTTGRKHIFRVIKS